MGVRRDTVTSATIFPIEPIYNRVRPEMILDLSSYACSGIVQIPQVGEFPLDVIPDVPLEGEFPRFIGVDIPLVGESSLDRRIDIVYKGEFGSYPRIDPVQERERIAHGILLRSASIPSYEKEIAH